jgi:putative aldouronate transport system permease protein
MIKRTFEDFAIESVLYLILILVGVAMIIPFVYVVGNSLITVQEYIKPGLKLIPLDGITFSAYNSLFKNPAIYTSYWNTLQLAVGGTAISLFFTTITGYVLSRRQLKGRSVITFIFILTMLVNGGIVPHYLVVKSLGLINRLWALILPVTINTYFMIILKSFFANLPDSLEESAYMDGANEVYILFKIFIPLSLPAMVTIGLFYGVNYWNSFFLGVLYLTDRDKWPLQLLLRDILIQADMSEMGDVGSYADSMAHNIKMATIVVAIVPIISVYPFLQKHFTKGILIGAVKG